MFTSVLILFKNLVFNTILVNPDEYWVALDLGSLVTNS